MLNWKKSEVEFVDIKIFVGLPDDSKRHFRNLMNSWDINKKIKIYHTLLDNEIL